MEKPYSPFLFKLLYKLLFTLLIELLSVVVHKIHSIKLTEVELGVDGGFVGFDAVDVI